MGAGVSSESVSVLGDTGDGCARLGCALGQASPPEHRLPRHSPCFAVPSTGVLGSLCSWGRGRKAG